MLEWKREMERENKNSCNSNNTRAANQRHSNIKYENVIILYDNEREKSERENE